MNISDLDLLVLNVRQVLEELVVADEGLANGARVPDHVVEGTGHQVGEHFVCEQQKWLIT
jgi:hypothetical protein